MAKYTVKWIPSLLGSGKASSIGYNESVFQIGGNGLETGTYKAYFKGDNAILNSYKTKRIVSINFYRAFAFNNNPSKIGIELLKFSETFDESITWDRDMPAADSVLALDIDYDGSLYQSNDISAIFDKITPTQLYNQLPIGFKMQVPYRGSNIPSLSQRMYGVGESETNKQPGIVFEFEDFTPTITEQIPSQGAYIGANRDNQFTITFESFLVIAAPTITKATFEFKDKSTGTTTTKDIGMTYSLDGKTSIAITVPSGTVINGKDYQWRIKFTTDDGGVGGFSAWADITTKDTVPHAPRIIEPQSAYLDGEETITFKWTHNSDSGSAQYAYDLDYRQGGDWKHLVLHSVTPQQEYTAPARTFGAGQLVWRVRTYNTDDVPGEYSNSDPSIVSAPPKPPAIISIKAVPRAIIKWSSVDQQAYQLIIKQSEAIVEDSGAIFGSEKERKIKACLPNGTYMFLLRIQNGQGDWSDYTSSQVQIVNRPTGTETITTEPIPGAVRIAVSILAEGQETAPGTRYILRDGKPIAKITGNSYEDYLTAGNHAYTLRVVADDGNYYDSNTVIDAPKIKYAFIAKLKNPKHLTCLKYNDDAPPSPQKEIAKNMTEHIFAGRSLPVYDVTEGRTITWNYQYSFLDAESYYAIERLVCEGDAVILRDCRGNRCIGVIQNIKKSGRMVITAEFDITEIDGEEEISYD